MTVMQDSDGENLRRAWERSTEEERKAFLEKEIGPLVDAGRKDEDEGPAVDQESGEAAAPLTLSPDEALRELKDLSGRLDRLTKLARKAQKLTGEARFAALTNLRDAVIGLSRLF